MSQSDSEINNIAPSPVDIVIAGGGLSAIFTGYELLKQASSAGQTLDILILAERLNTPCLAGSHAVLEIEGMFHEHLEQIDELGQLLRRGLDRIEDTIRAENIDCRFQRGYEIKARTREELEDLVETMSANGVYKRSELKWNSTLQKFKLPQHEYSVSINSIGQINMPEMIKGLLAAYQKLGGRIIEGATYVSQRKDTNGFYIIETNLGEFSSVNKPFIATGAVHQKTLSDFSFKAEVVHTMCCVIGPLSKSDALKISNGPMAICNTELSGDVLWGGLDEKGFLTFGRGGLINPSEKDRETLKKDILDQIEAMYPDLTTKYTAHISFGPMLIAENKMPIVGRLKDYDLAGGWAGMGIVAGYAAASAYARWIVNSFDDELKVFESLQPSGFLPHAPVIPGNKVTSALLDFQGQRETAIIHPA